MPPPPPHFLDNMWSAYATHPRPVLEKVVFDNGARQDPVLHATDDEFGGVTVEMKKDGTKLELYAVQLRNSMSMWKRQGKQGVWIKFPRGLENLHEITAREGFEYHHAERDYVMMTDWIPKTPSMLPGNATHRATIGAIVLNDRREEKKGKFRGIWKIPTGAANVGEDIQDAAEREVKEETAIDTEFMEILSFKQLHGAFFSWSEMTFFCMMRPTSFDIQTQETEIDAAEWMPMEAFAAEPFAREDEVCRHVIDVCFAKLDKVYSGLTPKEVKSTLDDKPCMLYLNARDL